jgi:hypothetical protein
MEEDNNGHLAFASTGITCDGAFVTKVTALIFVFDPNAISGFPLHVCEAVNIRTDIPLAVIPVAIIGLPVVVSVLGVSVVVSLAFILVVVSILGVYIVVSLLLFPAPFEDIILHCENLSITIHKTGVPAGRTNLLFHFILASVLAAVVSFAAPFEDIILHGENLSITIHETGVPGRTNLLVHFFFQFTLYTFTRYFGTS